MTERMARREIIKTIARYDREVAHPEIYEDLGSQNTPCNHEEL